jgi:hypothetical protein
MNHTANSTQKQKSINSCDDEEELDMEKRMSKGSKEMDSLNRMFKKVKRYSLEQRKYKYRDKIKMFVHERII